MGSKRYVYVGPYLRIRRVLREVNVFVNPHCCGFSYRGAEKFCGECGKALQSTTRKDKESAVDVIELQCGEAIQEAIVCQTSQGLDINADFDLWTPNGSIGAVELPDTDGVSNFELSAEHIARATAAFSDEFTDEIAAINAAYLAVGGQPGVVTYGVITYWM